MSLLAPESHHESHQEALGPREWTGLEEDPDFSLLRTPAFGAPHYLTGLPFPKGM